DYGGTQFQNDPSFAVVAAPNLTSGQGGVGATYSDADWEKALRHGVGSDQRGLVLMPSQAYYHFSDADLGALIAYVKSVPPVDREWPARSVAFLPKMLVGAGLFPVAAVTLDHAARPAAAAPGLTAEYGNYLTQIAGCRECHGEQFQGLTGENGPPPGPNLTPASELAGWTDEHFKTLMRTGMTSGGRQVSEDMPWQVYKGMTDEELQAIWLTLQALPPQPVASR
ncbi:MAG: cytochrome c, partial [Chloroflexota bacterium]|nr:cytochrome c [Chloroflexota bacterium]